MAARATWKGSLKISLVTIPIKVFPATDSAEGLHFNQLHGDCQTRLQQRRWCPSCDREVSSSEIVKGYEFETGRYVLLLEDELDAVQPPSTRVIDLVQFAAAAALDPIAIDRSYYLAPDGPRAAEAFAVMSRAMIGTVGVGKLAIYGREYLVAVRAPAAMQDMQIGALLLHTLHHAGELRAIAAIADDQAPVPRVPIDQVQLARKVISACMQPELNLAAFTDEYQRDIRRIIDAKIAGQEIVEPTVVAAPEAVPFRAALEQSLQAVSTARRKRA